MGLVRGFLKSLKVINLSLSLRCFYQQNTWQLHTKKWIYSAVYIPIELGYEQGEHALVKKKFIYL